MNIRPDKFCPEFEPLTRWQRFKERWFGIEPKRTRMVYKVGDMIVCAPGTYALIKDSMMIEYRDDGTGWQYPFRFPISIPGNFTGISIE